MRDSRKTQRAKILANWSLSAANGRVTQHAAQYNARVFELRRMGFTIKNKTRDTNGSRQPWLRLGTSPSDIRITQRPVPVQGSLEVSVEGGR
jgi:hypothetical protein